MYKKRTTVTKAKKKNTKGLMERPKGKAVRQAKRAAKKPVRGIKRGK